jgi:hypothetical protein
MKSLRIWALAVTTVAPALWAAEPTPVDAAKPEVVLPVMKVSEARFARFGLLRQQINGGDALVIWHVPPRSDMFRMLVGGAQVGDEIVSIDGRAVATIPLHQRQAMLRGYFKVVVKRATGRRSYQLLELDGRGE